MTTNAFDIHTLVPIHNHGEVYHCRASMTYDNQILVTFELNQLPFIRIELKKETVSKTSSQLTSTISLMVRYTLKAAIEGDNSLPCLDYFFEQILPGCAQTESGNAFLYDHVDFIRLDFDGHAILAELSSQLARDLQKVQMQGYWISNLLGQWKQMKYFKSETISTSHFTVTMTKEASPRPPRLDLSEAYVTEEEEEEESASL